MAEQPFGRVRLIEMVVAPLPIGFLYILAIAYTSLSLSTGRSLLIAALGCLLYATVVLFRRPVDLVITKNRVGPTATIPLVYFTAASVFEERVET